jgi:hypothetical protein
MNSETNSEMVLRYFCAIGPIGWNRLSNEPKRFAYFQLIRMTHQGAFPSGYFIPKPNKAVIRRPYSALSSIKGVKFA